MGVCFSAQTKPPHKPLIINSAAVVLSSKRGDTTTTTTQEEELFSSPSCSKVSSTTDLGGSSSSSSSIGEILQSSNLKSFASTELEVATRNFRADSVLGEVGGVGSVFKGWIGGDYHSSSAATGITVAVKKLNLDDAFQAHNNKWLAGVKNYLGQLSNPHLVKLIGYCLEDENHRFLVYEFMPRGNLENHLFRRGSYFQPLSWSLRLKVALGAAKGLAFLHSADTKLIYRDFKTSNVLLDSNYNAKLFNFGLTKDAPTADKSHVSTRVTYGYAAPEYTTTGQHTTKSDVYSFGVVLLEILSGRRAIDKNRPPRQQNLVEWAKPYLANKDKILRVLDNRLEGQYELDEAYKVATLSLRCLATEAKLRPNMDEVVTDLEKLQVPHVNGSNRNLSRRKSAEHVVSGGVRTAAATYPRRSASL